MLLIVAERRFGRTHAPKFAYRVSEMRNINRGEQGAHEDKAGNEKSESPSRFVDIQEPAGKGEEKAHEYKEFNAELAKQRLNEEVTYSLAQQGLVISQCGFVHAEGSTKSRQGRITHPLHWQLESPGNRARQRCIILDKCHSHDKGAFDRGRAFLGAEYRPQAPLAHFFDLQNREPDLSWPTNSRTIDLCCPI